VARTVSSALVRQQNPAGDTKHRKQVGHFERTCQARGTPLNTADGMIAATALEYDLTLVTRNVKDFAELRVDLLDPWDAL
jgi:predicted nucleic acid-binding protein